MNKFFIYYLIIKNRWFHCFHLKKDEKIYGFFSIIIYKLLKKYE